jgi:4-carboxymuconolactone decarboxylase
VTEEQLAALHTFEGSGHFSDVEKLVLRYATAMTSTPVEIPDNLFRQLADRFSEKQLVELTAAIAWENHRARFDHAFGVESANFSQGAACAVPVPVS